MPKVSKESASGGGDYGMVVDHSEDVDGYTINFITFRQDIDHAPLLRGLPDDRCQCPHWGYVLKGSLTYRFVDHDEVFEAGDAFYVGPGHVPVENEVGTECLQFSPADALRTTSDVIMRNLEALQVG
jgi:hypothetical protein